MAKKENQKTALKLAKLEKAFGSFKLQKTKISNDKKDGLFKMSEVVILLLITLIVSLIMGGAIVYKFNFQNGKKVDKHLQEFINNYDYIVNNYNGNVDKEQLIDAALNGMLDQLDKNSTYLDADTSKNFNTLLDGSYRGIGIQIYKYKDNIIIYGVFKNSPAAKAGLKPDDVLLEVNGKSLKGKNTADVVNMVKDKQDTIVIKYLRNDEEKEVTIKLDKVVLKSIGSKLYTEDNQKIGYIAVGIFASNSYEQFKKHLNKLEKQNINSLIIDLRGNSGGYLFVADKMLSLFLSDKHVIFQIQKDGNITKRYSKGKKDKNYKIVVLVDENSASASEVMASALKDQYGATLVGKKTYGKGTVQEQQILSNGDKYKLTTKNWLTSKGVWVEGKGIAPDIEIELDPKFYENGNLENDTQLKAALENAKK